MRLLIARPHLLDDVIDARRAVAVGLHDLHNPTLGRPHALVRKMFDGGDEQQVTRRELVEKPPP